jgi:hypothetical protein
VFSVYFVSKVFLSAHHFLCFVIEVDKFDHIGMVDGCPSHQQTVVIDQLLLRLPLRFVAVNQLLSYHVAVSRSVDPSPVFSKQVAAVVIGVPHRYAPYYNDKLYSKNSIFNPSLKISSQ